MTITRKIIGLAVAMIATLGLFAQKTSAQTGSNTPAPVIKILPLFTMQDVPKLGSQETVTPPLPPIAARPHNLPGHGMAEHSMLYFGEGYNQLLIVNGGKIILILCSSTSRRDKPR